MTQTSAVTPGHFWRFHGVTCSRDHHALPDELESAHRGRHADPTKARPGRTPEIPRKPPGPPCSGRTILGNRRGRACASREDCLRRSPPDVINALGQGLRRAMELADHAETMASTGQSDGDRRARLGSAVCRSIWAVLAIHRQSLNVFPDEAAGAEVTRHPGTARPSKTRSMTFLRLLRTRNRPHWLTRFLRRPLTPPHDRSGCDFCKQLSAERPAPRSSEAEGRLPMPSWPVGRQQRDRDIPSVHRGL